MSASENCEWKSEELGAYGDWGVRVGRATENEKFPKSAAVILKFTTNML